MRQQEIDSILTQIEAFKKLEIEEILSKANPNETDLGNSLISRMSVLEFVSLSKRLIKQLELALNGPNKLILPSSFSTADIGQYDVNTCITYLINYINSNQLSAAENMLLWLAHYELQNNILEKANFKSNLNDLENIQQKSDSIRLIETDIKKLKEQYNILIKDIKESLTSLNNFRNQKESELQQITNNLNSSNTNTNQIQNLLNTSTQYDTRINSILVEVEKSKSKIESTEENINLSFSKFKLEFSDLIGKLNKTEKNYLGLYSDFEEKLSYVESKHQYFTDRNSYLDNLIGREVGASLFETFKQRKSELNGPLEFWRYAVGVMGVLTFLAILGIFTNFFGLIGEMHGIEASLKWESILINSLKSLPFFFLLYYSISQYNKERNFQEEYAFKSAAALTIKAYADILNDDKNKDELILHAVYGIYRSPINENSKSIKDVNSALDIARDVIDKGSTLIQRKE
ncbi:hypothetical protein [Rufibacter psychrotolerans]|uniref:hypothetical protein n=1 Tax=Rufibacter psychrotolerans TaxID=2812556 RepID=UPI001966D889|nr:hypothetical protein [Rufibacter sp. SYSU D00308]